MDGDRAGDSIPSRGVGSRKPPLANMNRRPRQKLELITCDLRLIGVDTYPHFPNDARTPPIATARPYYSFKFFLYTPSFVICLCIVEA